MSGIVHDVGGYHSHKKLYIWTGLVLAVLTIVELLIPFWEWMGDARNPVLVFLAFAKLAGVIGIFMHLKDDRSVYRVVFLLPMLMALAAIIVLGLMAVRTFVPYGGGYVKLAVEKSAAERGIDGAVPDKLAPFMSEAELQTAFDAAAGQFDAGQKVFTEKCAACHLANGSGLANLGPNMTDDCYIHGGQMTQLMTTVLNGVPGKPMTPWSGVLSNDEIRDVVLYLHSLKGTNVEGGQPCQGDKVP